MRGEQRTGGASAGPPDTARGEGQRKEGGEGKEPRRRSRQEKTRREAGGQTKNSKIISRTGGDEVGKDRKGRVNQSG